MFQHEIHADSCAHGRLLAYLVQCLYDQVELVRAKDLGDGDFFGLEAFYPPPAGWLSCWLPCQSQTAR